MGSSTQTVQREEQKEDEKVSALRCDKMEGDENGRKIDGEKAPVYTAATAN